MKLSIITINKDNAEGLQKTLDSVACQVWHDFEHIIVDGASKDRSVDIIRDYAVDVHPYPVKWLSEPDTGIYNAMNKGIRMANGEYLFFLNSGDYLYDKNVLSKVFAIRFNEDVVYGYLMFNYREHVIEGERKKTITLRTFIDDTIHHSGNAFVKKEAFEQWGLYDEKLKIVSDWKWFLQAVGLSSATTRFVDVCTSVFSCDGISEIQKELGLAERASVIEELIPPRLLKDYEDIKKLEKEIVQQEIRIRSSWSYRLGYAILRPIKAVQKLVFFFN